MIKIDITYIFLFIFFFFIPTYIDFVKKGEKRKYISMINLFGLLLSFFNLYSAVVVFLIIFILSIIDRKEIKTNN